MKHNLSYFVAALCAINCCWASDFTPVPGFLQERGATVWNGKKAGQELIFAKAPDQTPAWQLSWNRELKTFAEIGVARRVEWRNFERIEFQLPYYSAGRNDLYGFGIRIEDSKGETFQWDARANDHAPGWKLAQHNVRPDNFNSCWGGDGNKKIDFPAKLVGFGIGFAAGGIGPVWLGDFQYRLPQEVQGVIAAQTLWVFDQKKERWWVGGNERGADAKELRVESPAKRNIRLDECMNGNRFYDNLRGIRVTGELGKGKKAELTVIFYDSGKKEYLCGPLVFTGGNQTLEFRLPEKTDTLRVKEAYVNFPEEDGGNLVLRRSEFLSEKTLLDAISMELETGSPIHMIPAGELSRLSAMRLTNGTAQKISCDAKIEFSDLFGERFSIIRKISLQPGEEARLPLELPSDLKFGIWYVKATFTAPGEKPAEKTRSFAYMRPAGPTKERPDFNNPADFLYGICNAPDRWSRWAMEMDAYSAAVVGAKVFRTCSPWGFIQRGGPNHWDFEIFDRLVEAFSKQGIELQALTAGCPRWAVDPDAPLRERIDPRGGSMPKLEPFRKYVRTVGERYKGKIRLWEVGNEPDHPGFAKYGPLEQAKLQTAAFEELHAVDPAIRVMTAGFAGVTGDSYQYQFETLKASAGKFDLHTLHLHGEFSTFQRQVDNELADLRNKLGINNIPWYANETALHSTGGNERGQAEALYTKLIFARARGSVGFTWYNMRDVGFNAMDNEHNYGMQKADFYPKAVFPAYAALVNTFRGFAYDRQLPLEQGEYGFLFRNGDTYAMASWKTADAIKSGGSYSIATDGKRAERIDLMGNASPVEIEGGRIFWTFNTTPETLKIYGAAKIEAEPIIDCEVSGCAIPGRAFTVKVNLANPLAQELSTKLSLKTPAEFKASPDRIEVKLAPGEKTSRSFRLSADRSLSGTFGSKYLLFLKADFGRNGVAELSFPVHSAALMSADINKEQPDFVLNQRRQIRVLYDNVPNKPFWTGPKDLSAEIRLGMDRNELVVRVKAEDDIHLQRQNAEDCWREDSVQFALWLPGVGGWEIGGAHKDGKTLKHIWLHPEKADPAKALNALKVTTSRQGTTTEYEFRLPLAPFRLTQEQLKSGFRFNLVVNDADEPEIGREGWAQIAPGIADTKNPDLYPFIVFK